MEKTAIRKRLMRMLTPGGMTDDSFVVENPVEGEVWSGRSMKRAMASGTPTLVLLYKYGTQEENAIGALGNMSP